MEQPAEEVEVADANERGGYARGHSARFFDGHLLALRHDALSDGGLQLLVNAPGKQQAAQRQQSGGQCETWAAADPLVLRVAVAQETVQCAAL